MEEILNVLLPKTQKELEMGVIGRKLLSACSVRNLFYVIFARLPMHLSLNSQWSE